MVKNKNYEKIIRVDHAGEFGAQKIYAGQIKFSRDKKLVKQLETIAKQEQKHLDFFEKKMLSKRIRPTLMTPLWEIGGFSLGALTAILGRDYVMACTDAVETIIVEHYKEQMEKKEVKDDKQLLNKIKLFMEEEAEHQKSGAENTKTNDLKIRVFKKLVEQLTLTAIKISERL